MIVFDLACKNAGHVFEIWFGSSEDYEQQKARGLVSCPYCGSTDVDKAVMAPNVAPKGNARKDGPGPGAGAGGATVPAAVQMGSPERFKEMITRLAELQTKMLEGSDYVGTRFADEARAMYLGESESRPIHGQTSIEEAKALIEEGVPVAPLPLPIRPPGSEN